MKNHPKNTSKTLKNTPKTPKNHQTFPESGASIRASALNNNLRTPNPGRFTIKMPPNPTSIVSKHAISAVFNTESVPKRTEIVRFRPFWPEKHAFRGISALKTREMPEKVPFWGENDSFWVELVPFCAEFAEFWAPKGPFSPKKGEKEAFRCEIPRKMSDLRLEPPKMDPGWMIEFSKVKESEKPFRRKVDSIFAREFCVFFLCFLCFLVFFIYLILANFIFLIF
jgi:hypothetical protein